jgi:4-hydroxy-tetrahydrodipicolinate synthase
MATARDAREWARSTLRGIGNSLYTPFCGKDGDDIDWDAYRTLVRYCVGELKHPMLWTTSGIAEFWSLTIAERKQLLEIAIEEGRKANPDVVVQACTAAMSAKDCLDLTRQAQEAGADIVYIQTPMMEAHGGEGVLNFFRYIADRTDIALGMFNSPSSGYVLTPAEGARIYSEIPAVCGRKRARSVPRAAECCTSSRLT